MQDTMVPVIIGKTRAQTATPIQTIPAAIAKTPTVHLKMVFVPIMELLTAPPIPQQSLLLQPPARPAIPITKGITAPRLITAIIAQADITAVHNSNGFWK